ncbi:MAG: ABC transporter ATP-binding protein [Lachnospiraceae bacterium]|nr:ABC transporter ATP-binding protein [Lachnospiraceae bacterium]
MGQERIKAVDGVSFTIEEGEFCCILGTSGSGKSTLLNLLAGIEKLTAGDIIINGSSIRKMNEKRLSKFRQENLGFVFQAYNLMGSMTALENVELPLVFKRISPGKRRKMARSILKKVGLADRMDHKPKEMSGGQQQRVGIARAFVAKPKIVFADEPTGNLDSKTTVEVMQLIKGMALKHKQTIVMVTHDISLARYADKIIHVSDGKIIEIEHNEHPLGCDVPEDAKTTNDQAKTADSPEMTGKPAEAENPETAGKFMETENPETIREPVNADNSEAGTKPDQT